MLLIAQPWQNSLSELRDYERGSERFPLHHPQNSKQYIEKMSISHSRFTYATQQVLFSGILSELGVSGLFEAYLFSKASIQRIGKFKIQ